MFFIYWSFQAKHDTEISVNVSFFCLYKVFQVNIIKLSIAK